MARRIINKACNDLVGGAGTDVSVSMGPDIPRKPSVMKLTSRDLNHGNFKQAVDVKSIDGRQVPKGPPQMVHSSRRGNVKLDEKAAKPYFVNIDGDSASVTMVDVPRVQQPKEVRQTAYKMRNFMSSVDLGHRGQPHSPIQMKQNPLKRSNSPPRHETNNSPKVPYQPDDGKMFLPKGIHHTDQPYVAPKFMPSFREMMVPKPKPDPLVSIVENTPPSLQKWAIEWNAEPKKTISIDELKEDLLREALEKSPKSPNRSQQESSIHKPNPDEIYKEEHTHENTNQYLNNTKTKQTVPNANMKNLSSYTKPEEKPHSNVYEGRENPPCDDLPVPTSYGTRIENQFLRNPDSKQKIDQLMVDWLPPKYRSPNMKFSRSPQDIQYSFQEAINNGKPNNKKSTTAKPAEPNPFFTKSVENAVYYDTEEQRFHDWFKERMSAAAQSTVSRHKTLPNNNIDPLQAPQSRSNTFSTVKDPSKPRNMTSVDPTGQNELDVAERNPLSSFNQSTRWKGLDDTMPLEVRVGPEPKNNMHAASHEPESNSSFYHWLKLRGHQIAKNEPIPPENKKEKENIHQHPQNAPLFPWSVSYTLRKRVSTPTIIPKRMSTPSVVPKRSLTAKNSKKSQKPYSQGNRTLKLARSSIRKPSNRIGHKSIENAGKKSHKTISEQSMNSSGMKSFKSNSKMYVKHLNKKIPKAEPPKVNASLEHSYLSDKWKIETEIDHVHNLRKAEIFGSSPTATNGKKLFPSMGSEPMKYWESKYIKKPEMAQNQKALQGVDNEGIINNCNNWYMPKTAFSGIEHVSKDVPEKNVNNRTDKEDKSSNLNLSQSAQSSTVMELSEDFNIDSFLSKEEAEEKELMNSTHEQPEKKVEVHEQSENEQKAKLKGKEQIKFPRTVQGRTKANHVGLSLKQRVKQKLDEDDFVLALGEDPGLEDLEWSEFIGPKNSLDHDNDLTRLLGAQARQLGAVQHSCL